MASELNLKLELEVQLESSLEKEGGKLLETKTTPVFLVAPASCYSMVTALLNLYYSSQLVQMLVEVGEQEKVQVQKQVLVAVQVVELILQFLQPYPGVAV